MAYKYNETILDTNSYLTNLVLGYKTPNPVADFIAPPFQVKLEAGKYAAFNKTVFRIWDDKISGSEEPKEIQWDVDEESYACEEYSMAKFVSDKQKANSIKPIDLDATAVYMLKRFHASSREYRINQVAGNAAIVGTTRAMASAWNVAGGTPITDIENAMGTVATLVPGYVPNRIVMSIQVALKIIQTTEWRAHFVFTDSGFKNGLFDCVSGLRQIGLEPMITNITGINTDKGSASDPTTESMWNDNVLLFYCEPNPNLECRTFMYSPYTQKDLIFTTRVPRRRGVYHDIYSDIDELLVDAQCGYLFTNTL